MMKVSLSIVAALVLAYAHAGVVLTEGDGTDEHSYDTAGHWSDSTAPYETEDYTVSLGAGAYLRTPTTLVTSSGSETDLTFAGQSLQIGTAGTPGNFYVTHGGYANLNVADLRLVSGTIWAASNDNTYYYANGGKKQLIKGQATVTSTVDDPFTFAPMGSATHSGIHLSANLVGDETAAIRCLGKNAAGNSAWMHLSVAGDNSEYHGRFIIEGGNACLWPGWCSCSDTTFGATPKTFMKDCIILKNGGYIHTEVSGNFTLQGTNRGIWVEGSGSFSSQGSYTVAMPVGGDGISVSPHQGAVITFAAPLSCSSIWVGNGAVNFTKDATLDDAGMITVGSNGAIGSSCDRTFRISYSGSGRSGFYYPVSVLASAIPVYTLSDDSTWGSGNNTCRLRLSSSTVPYGPDAPEWIPVLKVPLSVKDLSTVTFDVYEYMGLTKISNSRVKVETDSGTSMQTVYVGQECYYVVNSSNRPSGHAAKWPYDTWKTAGLDLYTVITTATARTGGVIYVGEGTYDVTSTITIFNGSKSYSIAGVNMNTMAPSPEKVIFDGGYPARSNRVFNVNGTGNCIIRDVTIQKGGYYNSTDGNWGGGGAVYAQSMSGSSRFERCRFLNNHSHHGGAAQSAAGLFTNCYFKGNVSTAGSAVFTNPQGGALGSTTYLTIAGCTFEENYDLGGGQWGACCAIGSSRNVRVYGCTFRKNGLPEKTGATIISWSYHGELHDCVFEDNYGYIAPSCRYQDPLGWHIQMPVSNLVFRRNVSASTLIAMDPRVYKGICANLLFESNTCPQLVSACTGIRQMAAYGNTCSTALMTLVNEQDARSYAVESMTIADNVTPLSILIQSAAAASRLQLLNSIVWGNKTTAGAVADSSVTLGSRIFSVENTCYEGTALDAYADATSFKRDPKFTPTYGIQGVSRCRDAGANQDWMTSDMTDMAGGPRRLNRQGKKTDDAIVDMGAFESSTPMPGFVVVFR